MTTMLIGFLAITDEHSIRAQRHPIAPCLDGTQSTVVFVDLSIRTFSRAPLTDASPCIVLCCTFLFDRNWTRLTMALLPPFCLSPFPFVEVVVVVVIVVVELAKLALHDFDQLLGRSRKTAGSCLPAKPPRVCKQYPMPLA